MRKVAAVPALGNRLDLPAHQFGLSDQQSHQHRDLEGQRGHHGVEPDPL